MRSSARFLSICLVGNLLAASSALAQKEIANPQAIVSAKTIYFEDKSGDDAVGKKASAELSRWGRFQIVQDLKKADLLTQIRRDLCSLHFAFFEQAFIHRAQDLFLSLGKRYQSAQFESAFWIV